MKINKIPLGVKGLYTNGKPRSEKSVKAFIEKAAKRPVRPIIGIPPNVSVHRYNSY